MDSISNIIESYIHYSKLKSDLEKTHSINSSLKKIKRNELEKINSTLEFIYQKFVDKVNIMEKDKFEKVERIINLNILKVKKESNDLITSINSFSKKNISIQDNCNDSLRYIDLISNKYLLLNELDHKVNIYRMFLNELNNCKNQKIYHKAV